MPGRDLAIRRRRSADSTDSGEEDLGRPQVSFAKRQREQAKRERKQMKDERRQQRKLEKADGVEGDEFEYQDDLFAVDGEPEKSSDSQERSE